MNSKPHKHAYYEYTSKHRRARKGHGGIVLCQNDPNCAHFLEPCAMQIFREIVASGRTPVIREYPRTLDRQANTMLVSIYPKPQRKRKGAK